MKRFKKIIDNNSFLKDFENGLVMDIQIKHIDAMIKATKDVGLKSVIRKNKKQRLCIKNYENLVSVLIEGDKGDILKKLPLLIEKFNKNRNEINRKMSKEIFVLFDDFLDGKLLEA